MHDDLAEARALASQFLPEPFRHVFDRWVLQAFDIVEVRVVEYFQKWLHGLADLRVVINPSDFRIDVAIDRYFDFKTVSVHPAAFVTLRGLRQSLGRFESEVLGQARSHDDEITIPAPLLSSFKHSAVLDSR